MQINISETFLYDIVKRIGNKLYKNAKEQDSSEIKPLNNVSDSTIYIQGDGSMVPIISEDKFEYKENKIGIVFSDKDIVKTLTKNKKLRLNSWREE